LISKLTTWVPGDFCSETILIIPFCSIKPSVSETVRIPGRH
jgi:hypothetical protein